MKKILILVFLFFSQSHASEPKGIVASWFSDGGATAGDLQVLKVVCDWLQKAGFSYDLAMKNDLLGKGVNWKSVSPRNYSHFFFVCGPVMRSKFHLSLVERFAHCRKMGVNVSMIDPLEEWNPFDVVFERDSSKTQNPDLAFLYQEKKVPVIGLILVHPQPEYGKKGRHSVAKQKITAYLNKVEAAIVPIDTTLPTNPYNLKTSAEIESLISHMDMVITTRMHGMVLALKNGVPALAVDAIQGGAKVKAQANTIGWPCCFEATELTEASFNSALEYCLTQEAKLEAKRCCENAISQLQFLETQFIHSL